MEKIYKLEGNLSVPNDILQYFLIYANNNAFQHTIDVIRAQINTQEHNDKQDFHIIVVPKILVHLENLLELSGLYDNVKLHAFQWFPISLDESLLTLEIPNLYKSLYLFNDLSFLSIYAKSMWQLFFVIGKPKFCVGIGQFSNLVLQQLNLICNELGSSEKQPELGGMLVIDRNIDYPSALLTPATYTALLNEVCDINCGTYSVKDNSSQKYDTKFNLIPKICTSNFLLDSTSDSIYNEIKHQHFSVVTAILSKLTKKLKMKGENITKEFNIQDGKNFVSTDLKDVICMKQKVNNHLQAAETIVNTLGTRFEKQKEVEENIIYNKTKAKNYKYLEQLITIENNKEVSLRLMCLMAVTQKLTDNEITNFLNKYFIEYGYNYGFVYNNLKRALFIEKISKDFLPDTLLNIPKLISNNFLSTATKLKQIPKEPSKIEIKTPNCCSFVFSGTYVPLVATAASMILNATPIKELQSKFETLGTVTLEDVKNYPLQNRSLIIYVIGGITYAEIAACNLLEKLTDSKIIIVSDKVISGNNIVSALLEKN